MLKVKPIRKNAEDDINPSDIYVVIKIMQYENPAHGAVFLTYRLYDHPNKREPKGTLKLWKLHEVLIMEDTSVLDKDREAHLKELQTLLYDKTNDKGNTKIDS